MSPAHAHGCLDLDAYSNSTNTNEATCAAEYTLVPNSANLNVAKRSASVIPDFSGNDIFESNRNPSQNHAQQQGQYYESSRHNNKPQYPRSPATATLTPLSASTSPYYDYPSVDAMSLSYEPSRTLATYPAMMQHEQPQEQDENNFQHHQYPPPSPLSEHPYHTQGVVDPTTGINMDMPELLQKEDSDAPSPGRSRPIPKPDREVTKGQDGRFICTWAACTEDAKSFSRKCEWSKVSDYDFPITVSQGVANLFFSIWTSTIDLINVLLMVVKSYQVLLTRGVSFGINEKSIISMAVQENNSTAHTRIASDIVARAFRARRT